ncbi:glycoside hydrolase family 43 protein [Parathielavia hyrcaniae]|uniref:Glycoside hydrolase family 43 protein n=1 Tax=Parathielavia hyrcaniae TaxID=113614 RepID=A0AAN6PRI6_9PEZI|nr:glycoside hydrolase family 43 protein [Parathielavia hyrcaniae]
MTYYNGYYYLMTTTWTNVQITRATTLEGLKTGQTRVVWTDSNPSRCCNVWAPELHRIGNTWYIYYTAGNSQNLDGQRMHVLRGGSNPWGSFSYAGQLTQNWGIDGSILRVQNKNYFVWSCFSGSLQSLCIAPMNSPTSIGAGKVLSEPLLPWERAQGELPVNEGATALYHNGRIFLVYSARFCWTPSYQLGVLTYNGGDPTLASSWTKTGPFFSSANRNYGPGHNSFVNSPDGTEIWNIYHATWIQTGNCDGNRYTAAKKVGWNADGSPNFGSPDPLGIVTAGPSGE